MERLARSSLPDESNLWIYASDRSLRPEEKERLDRFMTRFLDQWESHGHTVTGGYEIREGRFLLVAGRIPDARISGCGIDESVRVLDRIADELGFDWLPSLHVFFRSEDGSVRAVSRSKFEELARAGDVHAETPVFDVALDDLGTLRRTGLERPAGESWHAAVFPLTQTA